MNNVHFTSNTCEWETPISFFNKIKERYGVFDLDVCATEENKKAATFFDEQTNGLNQSWTGRCWMNPPYGRTIGKWMKKAFEESKKNNATVICLVPARTDTAWWHDYAMKGTIEFIRGRLKFGNSKNSAPFPSALVVFYPEFN